MKRKTIATSGPSKKTYTVRSLFGPEQAKKCAAFMITLLENRDAMNKMKRDSQYNI